MRLAWGSGDLEISGQGDPSYGWDGPGLRLVLPGAVVDESGGRQLAWSAEAVAEPDELSVTNSAEGLRVIVRHHVAEAWSMRVTLVNDSAESVAVDDVSIELCAGTGVCRAWLAGAAGYVILAPGEDAGHPVVLHLRQGRLTAADGRITWHLPASLAPAARTSFELAGRRAESWSDAARILPDWLPPLAVPGTEDIAIAAPDAAVTSTGSVTAEDGWTRIQGTGRERVVVDGPAGRYEFDADFAPALVEAARAAAGEQILAVRGTAQEPPIEEIAARYLLALHAGADADHIDVLAGQVLDIVDSTPTPSPFVIAALARESVRTGERATAAALSEALNQASDEPGTGVALVHSWVALSMAGRPTTDLEAAIDRVAAADRVTRAGVRDRLAAVERAALTRSRPADADLEFLLAVLGGGLPGTTSAPTGVVARAVAVASLLAEETTVGQWPVTIPVAAELARRSVLAGTAPVTALAWLTLAGPDL